MDSRASTHESKLKRYRQALFPAANGTPSTSMIDILQEGGQELLNSIQDQDLGAWWHHSLQSNDLLQVLPHDAVDALRHARVAATAGYLVQRDALNQVDRLFEARAIDYAIMKGVHVRECVYPEPALRPASDIDILVAPDDRQRAARVLLDAGYAAHPDPTNISHEATFVRGAVAIDLHWHMLRPGRTRVELTADLLAGRQRTNQLWGLSDDDTLFMMLTHPAFAKYVCSPNMGLARVADFLLWIHKRPVDWPATLQLLERAGLMTAAWTMLTWFRMLAPPDAHATLDGWIETVHPGRLRAAYLRQWLLRDLPSRWLDHPFLIQLGFTLPLHDRPDDALHAFTGLRQARRNRQRDTHLLLGNG